MFRVDIRQRTEKIKRADVVPELNAETVGGPELLLHLRAVLMGYLPAVNLTDHICDKTDKAHTRKVGKLRRIIRVIRARQPLFLPVSDDIENRRRFFLHGIRQIQISRRPQTGIALKHDLFHGITVVHADILKLCIERCFFRPRIQSRCHAQIEAQRFPAALHLLAG